MHLFDVFFDEYENKAVPKKYGDRELFEIKDKRFPALFAVEKLKADKKEADRLSENCRRWLGLGLHPNIMQLYDYVYRNGHFYIAHEWRGDAQTVLSEALYSGFSDTGDVVAKTLETGAGIAAGLAYAGTAGLRLGADTDSIFLLPCGVKIGGLWKSGNKSAAECLALVMLAMLCGNDTVFGCAEDFGRYYKAMKEAKFEHISGGAEDILRGCLSGELTDMDEIRRALCREHGKLVDGKRLPEKVYADEYGGHMNRELMMSSKDGGRETCRVLVNDPKDGGSAAEVFSSAPYEDAERESAYCSYLLELEDIQRRTVTFAELWKTLDKMSREPRIMRLREYQLLRRQLSRFAEIKLNGRAVMICEREFDSKVVKAVLSDDCGFLAAAYDGGRQADVICLDSGECRTLPITDGERAELKGMEIKNTDGGVMLMTEYAVKDMGKEHFYCRNYLIADGRTGAAFYETDEPVLAQDESYCGGAAEVRCDDRYVRIYAEDYDIQRIQQKFAKSRIRVSAKFGDSVIFTDEGEEEVSDMFGGYDDDIDELVIGFDDEEEYGKASLAELGERMIKLKDELSERVLGQENAVSAFCDTWFSSELNKGDSLMKKPRAIFTLAGPPGVGKTLLAESAAEIMGRPVKKFDMSGYSDNGALKALAGFEYTWKNSKAGVLTRYVLENPECVLIFDEIEKASSEVHKLFLQVLDRGELEDSYYSTALVSNDRGGSMTDEEKQLMDRYEQAGRKVSFRDAIIIFTTNVGRELYEGADCLPPSSLSAQTVLRAIGEDRDPSTGKPYFSGEFISRLSSGTVIMFEHLMPHDLISIERKEFEKTAERMEKSYGIKLGLGKSTAGEAERARESEKILTALLYSMGGRTDARRAGSYINSFVRKQLQKAIVEAELGGELNSIDFEMPADIKHRQVRELFSETEKPSVLVYSSERVYKAICAVCPDIEVYHAESAVKAAAVAANKKISVTLVDIFYSAENSAESAVSEAYSVIVKGARRLKSGTEVIRSLMKEAPEMPVYLLQATSVYDSITVRSFVDEGLRGVIEAPSGDGKNRFAEKLYSLTEGLHMQASAEELSRRQKVLRFDTRLRFNKNTGRLSVVLGSMALESAPSAQDRKRMVSDFERPKDRFGDIIGSKAAKKELKHISAYLSDPRAFAAKGYPVPTGVLLYGSPGTGKTMLARACAGESDVAFIATQGSELLSKGVEGVNELFAAARRNAPAMIFIDEIDTIGRQRTGEGGYTEAVLNTLLAAMDGFDKKSGRPVVVIAATNADLGDGTGITTIDSALARRFSKTIRVDEPDDDERKALLALFTGGRLTEEELETYSTMTIGMSPAEIKTCVMSALQEAIENGEELNGLYLENAIEYRLFGGENAGMSEEELRFTAWHETGHTLCHIYAGYIPNYVTVVSRGGYGGYMSPDRKSLKGCPSKRDLVDRILSLLGGRAAERIYFGSEDDVTIGAGSDLEKATGIAYRMINTYGMVNGYVVFKPSLGRNPETLPYMNALLKGQYKKAIAVIEKNRALAEALVAELMKKRRLTGGEIKAIVDETGFEREICSDDGGEEDGQG
ncbi:AAA family ATPase [uncultured Ruminococcus sp.]|uniref:AAA family ATPase n=1 Tax=uncultured Ruminococcus sp. TaxID=165186 RepID=UPI0025EC7AC2|nr:AAA family ATPase [uncultured Ruminococcus sp.]